MKIITNALEAKIVCIRGFAGGLTVPIQRVNIPIETIKYVKIAWGFTLSWHLASCYWREI